MINTTPHFTALYVEDEPLLREQYVGFLERRFNEVLIAKDGKEGLDLYEQHQPDIVITDLKMPVMDGVEMIKQIKQRDEKRKIIITSAHGDTDYMLSAIDLNVDKYILKPIRGDDFHRVIEEIKNQIALEREREAYQKYIETIINTQPSMVILNTKHELLIVNQEFLDFTKCQNTEEFTHKYGKFQNLFESAEGCFQSTSDDWVDEAIALHLAGHTIEVKIKNQFFAVYINPVKEDNEYVVTLANITLQKQFQQELERRVEEEVRKNEIAQAELVKKSLLESQHQLLRNIAHHWRQPLTIISMNLDTLAMDLEESMDEKKQKFFKTTQKTLQVLSRSIDEFAQYGRTEQKAAEFDLVALIWDLHHLISPLRDGFEIDCGCQLPDHPVMYRGPKEVLAQILITLYNNAIESIERHKQQEPDCQHVIAFSIVEDQDRIEIHIRDTGDQFSEKALQYLFQPYSSDHKLKSGSGLSLYNAHKLLGSINGSIEAHNLPEGESEIVCILDPHFTPKP